MTLGLEKETFHHHEGKTKQAIAFEDNAKLVRIYAKDDITAGDGKRHAIIPTKGALSTTTTVNVFRLLRRRGIPTAFIEQDGPRSFLADYCEMIPLEVVGRLMVDPKSSLLKRRPGLKADTPFDAPQVEFFLKTKDRRWKARSLPCDDPYLEPNVDGDLISWSVFEPNKEPTSKNELFRLPYLELEITKEWFERMVGTTGKVALALRDAWKSVGCDLRDFKLEFGISYLHGQEFGPIVADSIDNDSWRLWWDGQDISKQPFRDGASLDEVLRNYERVAEFTKHFPL